MPNSSSVDHTEQPPASDLQQGVFAAGPLQVGCQESQQYLATILATVQVGIVVIDAESHTIVEANPKAVELIDASREEILGSICHKYICPAEVGQCPITDLNHCVDCSDRQVITAKGKCITVVKTVAKITVGGRLHLVESFLDISDRKRAEEALRLSEERYRDLLENANDLVQSVDINGAFVYVNQAWKNALGYTDAEIAALTVFDVICPSFHAHCSLLFQELIGGATLPPVEVNFLAKDGREVALEGNINCSFVDGKPALTRGIFRDITERKRMERELQQSEERYRQLVEHAPEAIVVHRDGSFLYANREAADLFGVESPAQLVGQQVMPLIHPDYRELFNYRTQLLTEPGSASPVLEIQLLQPNGGTVDAELVGTGISLEGKPAVQAMLRDTTQRKLLEKKLQQEQNQWQRKLEIKVEEKTRHLKEAQAKLIQSEKMATLGEVVSGASHELNNPLAGILSAIQLLRSTALTQPIVPALMDGIDVLENIESAAIRCQKIVEDLIRFSTQTRCEFLPMQLNEVLRDSLEAMSDQFLRGGIEVKWQVDATLPSIEGDFLKLFEMFTNILQNAKNALPDEGMVEISTRLVKKYAQTPHVMVCIRDTGSGIPAKNLSKIFDPFFTTKPVGRGPGLGLTVSYGIIKRHGGDVDVRSTIGKGTKVTVALPVRQPKK